MQIAERLTEAVRSPLSDRGRGDLPDAEHRHRLGRGIRKPEELIERADRAMYSAKRRDDTNFEIAPDA